MVGLSMPRDLVARGIAAIEVVRLTLGFISGPLAQHADTLHGMRWTMVYVTGFALVASVALVLLLLKYYRRPHAPDLRRYVREGQPAFDSPAL
jgi:heme/copper-type cytochrome/quinol oxidase subunit 2